jgi:hypothetical protein
VLDAIEKLRRFWARPFWERLPALAVGVLLVGNLALVWLLPVLPGQDLPQHIAYVRIMADYQRPDLPFRENYLLPEGLQPYWMSYSLLALLARATSVHFAFRFAFTVYVLATFVAFALLSRAIHGRKPGEGIRATDTLAALLVWTPSLCMGLFQFAVAVPLVALGCAAAIRFARADSPRPAAIALGLCSAALMSWHAAAAASLLLFLVLYLLCDRTVRAAKTLYLAVLVEVSVAAFWSSFDANGLGHWRDINVRAAFKGAFGLEALNDIFKITWYDPPVKLTYALWTVLGPYRIWGCLFSAVTVVAMLLLLRRFAARGPVTPTPAAVRRTLIALAIISLLAPWGVGRPTELTFIELRLMTVAFTLSAAAFNPERARGRIPSITVMLLALLSFGHFAWKASVFSRRASAAVALLREARPPGKMLALVLDDDMPDFAGLFRMEHFLSMYYTIDFGGLSAQFWGRYTEHLPIDYRPAKRLPTPPDWRPYELSEGHLAGHQWALVRLPAPDAAESKQKNATKVRDILSQHTQLVRCQGQWCLYSVKR